GEVGELRRVGVALEAVEDGEVARVIDPGSADGGRYRGEASPCQPVGQWGQEGEVLEPLEAVGDEHRGARGDAATGAHIHEDVAQRARDAVRGTDRGGHLPPDRYEPGKAPNLLTDNK